MLRYRLCKLIGQRTLRLLAGVGVVRGDDVGVLDRHHFVDHWLLRAQLDSLSLALSLIGGQGLLTASRLLERVLVDYDVLALVLLTFLLLYSFSHSGSRLLDDFDFVVDVVFEVATARMRTWRQQRSLREVLLHLRVSRQRQQGQYMRMQRGP